MSSIFWSLSVHSSKSAILVDSKCAAKATTVPAQWKLPSKMCRELCGVRGTLQFARSGHCRNRQCLESCSVRGTLQFARSGHSHQRQRLESCSVRGTLHFARSGHCRNRQCLESCSVRGTLQFARSGHSHQGIAVCCSVLQCVAVRTQWTQSSETVSCVVETAV